MLWFYKAFNKGSQDPIILDVNKLDGVGPVDNRPSTNYLHHLVQFFLKVILFNFLYKNVKNKK